jgi:peptide/nickel transport system substrate-binding protein
MNGMMKKGLALSLAMLMMLALLTGCGGDTANTPAPATAAPTEAAGEATGETTGETAGPRTLIIATNADIQTTDPQIMNSGPNTAVLHNVYSNLIKQNDAGKLDLDLAVSYKMLDDQLTWEFKLREDALFHDGTPVTAADVAYSINRVITDETGADFTNFSPLKEAKAIDTFTVQIISKEPYPVMLNLLAKGGASILPKAYIEKVGMDEFVANPIGSGPYKLTEYVKDDHVTLVPFADYYGEQNPDWNEVIFRVVPESSTRVGELIAGNVDLVNLVIPAEWDRVNGNEGTSIVNGPSTRVYQLALKVDKGPTSDLRVRQAIDLAIDDNAIVDQILKGAGTPTQTRIPSGINGCNEDLVGVCNYDPERAKELLAEAGYADGFTLKIEAPTGRYLMDTEICQAVSAMLAQVGITVDLQLLESSAYSNVFSAHSSEEGFMTCFGLGFFDASYGMIGYIGGNTIGESNYANPAYEELFYEAESNMDPVERVEQFKQLQQMIADDVPYVIMCQIDNSYGVNDSVTMNPRLDDVWNLVNIRAA